MQERVTRKGEGGVVTSPTKLSRFCLQLPLLAACIVVISVTLKMFCAAGFEHIWKCVEHCSTFLMFQNYM